MLVSPRSVICRVCVFKVRVFFDLAFWRPFIVFTSDGKRLLSAETNKRKLLLKLN